LLITLRNVSFLVLNFDSEDLNFSLLLLEHLLLLFDLAVEFANFTLHVLDISFVELEVSLRATAHVLDQSLVLHAKLLDFHDFSVGVFRYLLHGLMVVLLH